MEKPTQTQINEYVKTLDRVIQDLHRSINTAYLLTLHDTLSDEFQIVANLLDVFSAQTDIYRKLVSEVEK